MYHRVETLPGYPFPLAVTPENFDAQMAYIRHFCRPMRLSEMVEAVRQGRVPRAAIAVTFDDGYLDNLTHAFPVLKKYQIPATIFVSSGQIDSGKEFWWDELERVLLNGDSALPSISLFLDGETRMWPVHTAAHRQRAIQEIRDKIRRLRRAEREKILSRLAKQMGDYPDTRPSFLTMTSTQLRELSRHELIDVGAHTITHPVLSALTRAEQEEEIAGGRSRLEQIIGRPVTTFAYPYGGPEDFNQDSLAAVRSCGFDAACATSPGTITRGCNLFTLPRCWIDDWDARHFGWRLTKYFRR
jgi:peptidoglycan/xylan/chitin deacetylase (PgdA/CDA1 family)